MIRMMSNGIESKLHSLELIPEGISDPDSPLTSASIIFG